MSLLEYEPETPWLRQPFDTDDRLWAVYTEYLLAGASRSLAGLAKRHRAFTYADIQDAAWRDGWADRVAAWDGHLDQKRLETVEAITQEDARAVAMRHGRLAKRLFAITEAEAIKLADRIEKDKSGFGLLTPRELIRFFDRVTVLERLIHGESTENVQAPDVSGLTVDELRQARELQEKAGVSG